MPPIQWPPTTQSARELLSSRNTNASSCLLWAVSAVDALAYLDDLDLALDKCTRFATGHDGLVVDVAHARWAAGTAMTALDLCAAAIGFLYLSPPRRGHYYGLGNILAALDKAISAAATSDPSSRGPGWPPRQGVRPWIVDLTGDPHAAVAVNDDYALIRAVRDPLTHRTLTRRIGITVGSGPNRVDRTMLEADGQPDPIPVHVVVDTAARLAARHVRRFAAQVARGRI
jgi:hypothetical protein